MTQEQLTKNEFHKGEAMLDVQAELEVFPLNRDDSNKPVQTFKNSGIYVNVFRTTVDGYILYSCTVSRSYKLAGGGIEFTKTMRPQDLLVASFLLNEAYGWIRRNSAIAAKEVPQ